MNSFVFFFPYFFFFSFFPMKPDPSQVNSEELRVSVKTSRDRQTFFVKFKQLQKFEKQPNFKYH